MLTFAKLSQRVDGPIGTPGEDPRRSHELSSDCVQAVLRDSARNVLEGEQERVSERRGM